MSPLFGPGARNDDRARHHFNSRHQFLDRARGAYWERVRHLLEDWASHLPDNAKNNICGRLRDKDDNQVHAAFWELYVHEALRRSGWTIEVHPVLPGTRRTPDFRCRRGTDTLIVECTSIPDTPDIAMDDKRLRQLTDALKEVNAPAYYLILDSYRVGAPIPKATRLSREIERWLESLDADRIRQAYEDGTWLDLEPYEFVRSDGWHLWFRPWPLRQGAARAAGSDIVGLSGPGKARCVNHATPLHGALVNKLSAYGRFACPYVIAISDLRLYSTSTPHVDEALFGPEGFLLGRGRRTTANISGVLVAWHLERPESLREGAAVLWRNPAADHLLPDLPWETRTYDPSLGSMRVIRAGEPPENFFGLSEGWPGPERPFR